MTWARALGRGCLLAKLNLKEAYRAVPIHPSDQRLLAVSWKDTLYLDRALPFGLRSAPKIFSALTDAMMWTLHGNGVEWGLLYLDDFLVLGPPGQQARMHWAPPSGYAQSWASPWQQRKLRDRLQYSPSSESS